MSELLTTEDVAEMLRIPERTLSQWRYLGRGPAYIRAGRHVRYRPTEVEAWLDGQTTGASK